jgi:hypothetical protein
MVMLLKKKDPEEQCGGVAINTAGWDGGAQTFLIARNPMLCNISVQVLLSDSVVTKKQKRVHKSCIAMVML